jgi:hypothetical protein
VGFPGSQVSLGPTQRSQDEPFGNAKALYDGVFLFPPAFAFLLGFALPRVELGFLSAAPSLVFKLHFVQTGFAPLGNESATFHRKHSTHFRLPSFNGKARKCLIGGTPSARTWYAIVDGALPSFSAIETSVSPELKRSRICFLSAFLT